MLELGLLDHRAARIGETFSHVGELGAENLQEARARAQNFEKAGDALGDRLELLGDLFALEPREAVQAQIQDGARLRVGQPVAAVGEPWTRCLDEIDQRRDRPDRPRLGHQPFARRRRVGRLADERDHRIEVDHGEHQADQHMRPIARLAELEGGAPPDDFLAEPDEGGNHVLER